MSNDFDPAPGLETGNDIDVFRNAEGHISPLWLERLRAYLEAGRSEDVAAVIAPLHHSDVGDVLEQLDAEERLALVRALGDKFDFKGFHDTVLGGGALPLTLLERRVDQWIAKQKAAKPA